MYPIARRKAPKRSQGGGSNKILYLRKEECMKSQNKVTKLLLSALVVLSAMIAVASPAQAQGPTLSFTAAIDPTASYVGETKNYTITLTNIGSGSGTSYYLSSAKVIVLSSGFTVDDASLSVTRVPSGTAWTAQLVGDEIQLSTSGTGRLSYGQSVLISFDATAIAVGTWEWTTSAYHGTDWTTPAGISGSQPTVTVTSPTIAAIINIDPDTLNLSSDGIPITAYIQFPQGYNVEDIDVASILLNDEIPVALKKDGSLWSELQDADSDGTPETLMVKFDRSAVQAILNIGEEVEITITGTAGGIPFVGSDTIRVIDQGN